MKLADYVKDVQRNGGAKADFPDSLELPPSLVDEFDKLYKAGEDAACEYGFGLTMDEDYATFIKGPLASGKAYMPDMDIPKLMDARFFGNVHSHPTTSIGEAGGYSAHSMDDCLSFSEYLKKPLFIGFVVSGPWIYAMVYRAGLTKFDETAIGELKYTQAVEMRDRYLLEAWGGKMESLVEWQMKNQSTLYEKFKLEGLGADKITEQVAVEERKILATHKREHAKELGALGQHLSLRDCAKLAETLNFGSFAGMKGQGTKDGRDLARLSP